MEFSKRLDLFGDEIFAALNERKVALEAQGRTIYNLSVGTPDFAPAEHIRKAMMDAAADPHIPGRHGDVPAATLPRCQQAADVGGWMPCAATTSAASA